MSEELTRSQTRVLGFPDGELDFQLLRQLGSASYGGASVGEGSADTAPQRRQLTASRRSGAAPGRRNARLLGVPLADPRINQDAVESLSRA
jgi:hypothetical protein